MCVCLSRTSAFLVDRYIDFKTRLLCTNVCCCQKGRGYIFKLLPISGQGRFWAYVSLAPFGCGTQQPRRLHELATARHDCRRRRRPIARPFQLVIPSQRHSLPCHGSLVSPPRVQAREREFAIPKESAEDKRRSRALLTIQSVGVISAALSFGTLALCECGHLRRSFFLVVPKVVPKAHQRCFWFVISF